MEMDPVHHSRIWDRVKVHLEVELEVVVAVVDLRVLIWGEDLALDLGLEGEIMVGWQEEDQGGGCPLRCRVRQPGDT